MSQEMNCLSIFSQENALSQCSFNSLTFFSEIAVSSQKMTDVAFDAAQFMSDSQTVLGLCSQLKGSQGSPGSQASQEMKIDPLFVSTPPNSQNDLLSDNVTEKCCLPECVAKERSNEQQVTSSSDRKRVWQSSSEKLATSKRAKVSLTHRVASAEPKKKDTKGRSGTQKRRESSLVNAELACDTMAFTQLSRRSSTSSNCSSKFGLTEEEKKLDKRERNKLAARRLREKRKKEKLKSLEEVAFWQEQVTAVREHVDQLEEKLTEHWDKFHQITDQFTEEEKATFLKKIKLLKIENCIADEEP